VYFDEKKSLHNFFHDEKRGCIIFAEMLLFSPILVKTATKNAFFTDFGENSIVKNSGF